MLFTVLAEFFELQPVFKSFFILFGKIIYSFAFFALQLDHVFLRHKIAYNL